MQIEPNKLAEARLSRAMSQEEAAIASDLSARTIQRIEAGHPASLESTKALVTIFGADILCDPDARPDAGGVVDWRALGVGLVQASNRTAHWSFDGFRLLFAAVFVLIALAKPLAPATTGLFVGSSGFGLGVLAQPPALADELLGYWISPLMLFAAAAMLVSVGRIRRQVLDRLAPR